MVSGLIQLLPCAESSKPHCAIQKKAIGNVRGMRVLYWLSEARLVAVVKYRHFAAHENRTLKMRMPV